MPPRIYVAAPLFSAAERAFNRFLKESLLPYGAVFLPQEDGSLLVQRLANGEERHTAAQAIFEMDLTAIRRSDLVVAVLDGRTVDEGVACELGLAYACDIRCVGLQTDPRRLLPSGNNPMIDACLSATFDSVDRLVTWVVANYGEA